MATSTRWKAAQDYERAFWEQLADRIAAGAEGQLDWYRWRSDQLVERLEAASTHTDVRSGGDPGPGLAHRTA